MKWLASLFLCAMLVAACAAPDVAGPSFHDGISGDGIPDSLCFDGNENELCGDGAQAGKLGNDDSSKPE